MTDIAVGAGGSFVCGSNASLTNGKEACFEGVGKVRSLSLIWGEVEVWRAPLWGDVWGRIGVSEENPASARGEST